MPQFVHPTITSTDSRLLERVRRSEPDAWQRFLALYAPLVYGWCRRAGLSTADAADVTQDVFTKAFTALADFRHERSTDTLRGWLRAICRTKVIDFFRVNGKGPRATGGTDAQLRLDRLAAIDDEDEATNKIESSGVVHRALELVRREVEPRTWQAFWLLTVEQCSTDDVACRLSMTRGAVRQAKYVILRRMREELGDDFD